MVSLRLITLSFAGLAAARVLDMPSQHAIQQRELPDIMRRDAGDNVVAALKVVHEKIKVMTSAMEAFSGAGFGLSGATLLPPQAQLETAIRDATKVVAAEPLKVSDAEGQKVVDFIQTFLPDVKKQIDVVVGKTGVFGLIKPIVLGEMNKMRTLSNGLADEIIKRAPDNLKDTAKTLEAQINAEWKRGIDAFST